jgi:hypothetical protein
MKTEKKKLVIVSAELHRTLKIIAARSSNSIHQIGKQFSVISCAGANQLHKNFDLEKGEALPVGKHNSAPWRKNKVSKSIYPNSEVSDIPPKPVPLRVKPEGIPRILKEYPQWVTWNFVWREGKGKGKGKWDKPPLLPDDSGPAKSNDPSTWSSFETVMEAYQRGNAVAFMKFMRQVAT